MLSAAFTGRADCRQGNCARLSLYRGRFPVRPNLTTNSYGRGRHRGISSVAKAVGWRVRCLPDRGIGRPSGECRFVGLGNGPNKNSNNGIWEASLRFFLTKHSRRSGSFRPYDAERKMRGSMSGETRRASRSASSPPSAWRCNHRFTTWQLTPTASAASAWVLPTCRTRYTACVRNASWMARPRLRKSIFL